MAKTSFVGAELETNVDTFGAAIGKTNNLIYEMGTSVVTTSASTRGDTTVGNTYVNGVVGADTLVVFSALRGGTSADITTNGLLTIDSNLTIDGTTLAVSAATTITGTATLSGAVTNLNSGDTNLNGSTLDIASLDVNITGTTFDVSNASTFTGTHGVSGVATFTGATTNLNSVDTNITGTTLDIVSAVDITGAITVSGISTLNGNAVLTGTTNSIGGTTLNVTATDVNYTGATAFDISHASAVTTVGGATTNLNSTDTNITGTTLDITAATGITGATSITGTLGVSANTSLNGATNAIAGTTLNVTASANTNVTSTNIGLTGILGVTGAMTVSGIATLNGNAVLAGTTNSIGGTTLNVTATDVNFTGATTFDISAATAVTTLGGATTNLNSTDTNISGTTLDIVTTVDVTGPITVSGISTLNGNAVLTGTTNSIGGTTLNVTATDINLTGASATLDVTSATSVVTLAGNVNVGKALAVGTTLAVTGISTLAAMNATTISTSSTSDLSAGTVTGPSGTWDSGGMDLATTDTYAIAGTDVLTATTLGSAVLASSLTSVGTITSGVWSGTVIDIGKLPTGDSGSTVAIGSHGHAGLVAFDVGVGAFTDSIVMGNDTPIQMQELDETIRSVLTITASDIVEVGAATNALVLRGTGLTFNDGTSRTVIHSGNLASQVDHDTLTNFVADEHIAHSGVSIIAGAGMTGGGTIAASRTLNVIGGSGIAVSADSLAVDLITTTSGLSFTTNKLGVTWGGSAGNYGVANTVARTDHSHAGLYNGWNFDVDTAGATAVSSGGTLDFIAGTSISLTKGGAAVTINHGDTSSITGAFGGTGATVVGGITIDGNGHATSLTTKALTYADLGVNMSDNLNITAAASIFTQTSTSSGSDVVYRYKNTYGSGTTNWATGFDKSTGEFSIAYDASTNADLSSDSLFSITTAGQTNLVSLDVVGNADAATFSGSGASLTSLNANNISTGTISTSFVDNLSGTNTGDNATNTQYSGLVTNVSTNLSTTHNASNVVVSSSDGTNATINVATSSTAGIMSEAIYDAHVVNNAKVSDVNHNVSTNLSMTRNTVSATIVSSDGTNTSIPVPTSSLAGVMTAAHWTKLNGIATGATANAGDITGVTAGSGMSGGGTTGTVTITNASPNIVQTTVSGSSGSCTGNSATATTATTATKTVVTDYGSSTTYPVVFHNNSNTLYDDTSKFTYKASTGLVTSTDFAASSDRRLKKDISTLGNLHSLDIVKKLQPVTYKWIDGDDQTHDGFIAQDVEVINSAWVSKHSETGFLGVNYQKIIPVVVGSVQELSDRNDELEKRIAKLEALLEGMVS